jgi:hypothetical protein
MKIFSPKHNSLRDFCYINLFVFDDHTELLKGATVIDKLKFIGLKQLVKQKLNQMSKELYVDHCFDMDRLKSKLSENGDNGWDSLLNNVVMRIVIKNSANESERSNDLLSQDILAYFTLEIQSRHSESDEILKLKNKKMELETSMDLLIAEACCKNSKGQYSHFR